ncbi:MAG: hypothetical protein J5849_01780 [Clostridia bacterium]|nr:hypothetical protein [Clostridia bacterium]
MKEELRPIADQHRTPYAVLPFGKGNVSGNGCGVVALYHTLLFRGEGRPFEEVLSACRDNRLWWRKGVWGMAPWNLKKFLALCGIRGRFFFGRWKGIEKKSREGDVVILATFNKKWLKYGVHNYACRREADGWRVYNNGAETFFPTLREAAHNRPRLAAIRVEGRGKIIEEQ